jgi:O-methyltransferase involved in polyketide biosynthesis
MSQNDRDTCDLANSAEAAAPGVAAGCALARGPANPLIEHPFAEPLMCGRGAAPSRAELDPGWETTGRPA